LRPGAQGGAKDVARYIGDPSFRWGGDGGAPKISRAIPPRGFAALLVASYALGAMPAMIGALLGGASTASAHGVIGQRFFPATLTTDDPFVADEMSLPTVSHQKTGTDPSVKETAIDFDFAKRITPEFGIVMGYGWKHLDQLGPPRNPNGFGNFEITGQWQFFRNDPHEAVAMIGLSGAIGGTGAKRIGADGFTTLTPTFYFGKGAGDLPETMNWLQPFAVTGTLGYSIPTRSSTSTTVIDPDTGDASLDIERHSNAIQYGLAIQYSLPYLTSNIQDLGLPVWMNRLTPLVEFRFTQPVDNRFGEQTTGTINPGIIWSGQSIQLGIEAIIPATRATGKNVGVIAQVHFYLDDIFPQTLGRPLFGGK
jgi:hypothetical protein